MSVERLMKRMKLSRQRMQHSIMHSTTPASGSACRDFIFLAGVRGCVVRGCAVRGSWVRGCAVRGSWVRDSRVSGVRGTEAMEILSVVGWGRAGRVRGSGEGK